MIFIPVRFRSHCEVGHCRAEQCQPSRLGVPKASEMDNQSLFSPFGSAASRGTVDGIVGVDLFSILARNLSSSLYELLMHTICFSCKVRIPHINA